MKVPDGKIDREGRKKWLLNAVRVFFLLVALTGLYSINTSVSDFEVQPTPDGLNVSGGECYWNHLERVCYADLEVVGVDTGVPLVFAVSNSQEGKGTLDYAMEIINREW